ncbi:hypothetical protein AN1V17_49810 [Vallitalea sediminicola]
MERDNITKIKYVNGIKVICNYKGEDKEKEQVENRVFNIIINIGKND